MAMRSSDTIGAVAGIGALGLMGLLGFGLFQQSSKGGCDNILYRGLHPGCKQLPDGSFCTTDANDKVTAQRCSGTSAVSNPGAGSTGSSVAPGSPGFTGTPSPDNCGGWTRRLTAAEFATIGDPAGQGPIQTIRQLFTASGVSFATWYAQNGSHC